MKILIVLIFAVNLVESYALEKIGSGDFWSAIGDEVNAEESIEPAKTHELLLHLKSKLEGKFDRASGHISYQVIKFLEANNVEAIKCNRASFGSLDALISIVQDHPQNLLPYLHNCRQRQYQLCRPLMEKSLKEDVEKFVEGEGKDAKELIDAIYNGTSFSKQQLIDRNTIKELKLLDGIFKFMESKVGSMKTKYYLNSNDGYEKFEKLYKQLVVPECRKVLQTTSNYYYIYYYASTYGARELVDETTDDLTAQWISYSSICRYMTLSAEDVSWAAYRKLNPKATHKKLIWGFIPVN